jgi:hypothetical protein
VKTSDLHDQTTAAWAYEALHVPALLQQCCVPTLDAGQIGPGARLLGVARSTGVLVTGIASAEP